MHNMLFNSQTIISLLIILGGMGLSRIAHWLIGRFGETKKIARSRRLIIQKLTQLIILLSILFTLIIFWGIKWANIWVVLTSVLGIIGIGFFAAWSFLSNIFVAFLFYFTVPFKIGDEISIIDGDHVIRGKVRDMTLFHIKLKSDEISESLVPNNYAFQRVIIKHYKSS